MKTQQLKYTNGTTSFVGYLVWDDARHGQRPGVLVFPEAFGLNDHARERAERLAQAGYVALAVDPHGAGVVYNDLAAVVPVIQAMYADRVGWRSRAQAALYALVALPFVDSSRIGAIGFCFGGTTCLELARSGADVAAIATFHSRFTEGLAEDAGRIRSKVLICHGAEDPLVSQESIAALMSEFRRDKIDWQFLYLGNATHSFTNPEADQRGVATFAYSESAEARSWAAMRHLFDATLNL